MADTAAPNPQRLEIRKYPNRRYYDTTRSRHVTLEEIYALIRDGYEVQIVDSRTGQDITAKILAQIIIELDANKLDVFPVPLLHRLLRSNQQLVTDFVQRYFNQPLASFLDSQRNFEQHLREMLGVRTAIPTMADWTRMMMWGPFNPGGWVGAPKSGAAPEAGAEPPTAEDEPPAAPSSGGATAPPPPPGSAPSSSDEQATRQIVEELRRQVTELASQLKNQNSNGPRKDPNHGGHSKKKPPRGRGAR